MQKPNALGQTTIIIMMITTITITNERTNDIKPNERRERDREKSIFKMGNDVDVKSGG